jgi:hypothetical protein
MAQLGVHEGTGLSVYHPRDVAWRKSDIRQKAASGEASFLRGVTIEVSWLNSDVIRGIKLRAFLELADAALAEAATALNAKLVPHQWALARSNIPSSPLVRHELLVPDGYELVASVENIPNITPLLPHEVTEVDQLAANVKQATHEKGYYMYDTSSDHCVNSDLTRVFIDPDIRLSSDQPVDEQMFDEPYWFDV